MFRKILNYCKEMKVSQIILVLVVLIAIPVAVFLTKKITKLTPSAALATVDLYIEPATSTLPPDGIFKVYLDPKSQKITFAKVVINFDKTKVQLSSELTTTALISNVIQKTTMSEANSSGQIVLVLAVPPAQTPPSAIFEIANFGIKKISTISNDQTAISFNSDSRGIQIVEETAANLSFNTRSSNLTLNPVANTPTPFATTTVTPTSVLPDLTISGGSGGITVSPLSQTVGQPVNIKFTIINKGLSSAPATFMYTNQSGGSSSIGAGSTCSGSTVLAPNGTCISSYNFTFSTIGAKTLTISLDSSNVVVESDETNNLFSTTVTITAAPTSTPTTIPISTLTPTRAPTSTLTPTPRPACSSVNGTCRVTCLNGELVNKTYSCGTGTVCCINSLIIE